MVDKREPGAPARALRVIARQDGYPLRIDAVMACATIAQGNVEQAVQGGSEDGPHSSNKNDPAEERVE